jgi:hypothetical protein
MLANLCITEIFVDSTGSVINARDVVLVQQVTWAADMVQRSAIKALEEEDERKAVQSVYEENGDRGGR